MRRFVKVIISLIVIVSSFSVQAKAEVINKPTLKIIVKNPPSGEYYLDLLVDYTSYNSYTWFQVSDKYNEEKLNILKGYNLVGWRSATLTGTNEQLTGELIGTRDGDKVIHEFSNSGIPEKFKIIILTEDNKTITSDVIYNKSFNEVIQYDFQRNKIKQTSMVTSYLKQIILTLIVSLVLEGLLLVLFGFKLKNNLKRFLTVNIITQVILNIVLSMFISKFGMLGISLFYMPVQLVIFIIETVLFLKLLRPRSRGKIIAYVAVSNVANYLVFYALIDIIFFIPFIK